MTQIIETVSFRAASGVSDAQIVEAVNALMDHAPHQQGVINSSLYKDADGTWHEHYLWTDLAAYQAAFAGFMAAPQGQALLALLDADSVEMRHDAALASYAAA